MADHPFQPGDRLIAYFRDSGGRDQDMSVPQQEEQARRWCDERGLVLAETFSDLARSGSTTAGRDGFKRMVQYLRTNNGVAGIIIWRWSRIARDFDDAAYFRADMRRRGYEWHSLMDNIPSGLEGRLIESFLDWHNQLFLDDLSADIKRGLAYIVSRYNAFLGPHVPAGYRRKRVEIGKRRDGTPHLISCLEPDPVTAPAVRRAFRMRAEGATLLEIMKTTHIARTASGVRAVLLNHIYTGTLVREGVKYENFCEALISPELWEMVQEVNRKRASRYGPGHPRRVRSSRLLTGLVRCGRCGHRMGAVTMTKSTSELVHHYYRCTRILTPEGTCGARYIPRDQLDNLVIERILSEALSLDAVRAYYSAAQARAARIASQPDDTAVRLSADLRDTQTRIKRITAAIAEMGHSRALLEELTKLEKREREIRQELEAASSLRRQAELPELNDDELAALAGELAAKFTTEDRATKIEALRALVVEIRAERDNDGKIRGKITFSPPLGAGELKEIEL